jgi:hypothetical protein
MAASIGQPLHSLSAVMVSEVIVSEAIALLAGQLPPEQVSVDIVLAVSVSAKQGETKRANAIREVNCRVMFFSISVKFRNLNATVGCPTLGR